MVVSVQNSQALRNSTTKLKSIEKASERVKTPANLRMQLSEALQSSLELDTLLKLFMENVNTAVKLDGIQYFNEPQGIDKAIAKQASHSCGYRLITSEDKLGEIVFKRSRKFSEKELGILESLLGALINPLRNALQYSNAVSAVFKDPMTGTGNTKFLQVSLDREIDLAKRHNQPLSVVILEIHELKEFKQNFGRDYHDKVITNMASHIETLARNTDTVFRINDNQFLVLLNNTDRNGAQVINDRLCAWIDKKGLIGKMSAKKKALGMTSPHVNSGVTTLTGTDSSKSFIERAKKALYRNRKHTLN
ncbi:MAG: GGDEF domain-containing protein [Pseudohongiellaceae bacterium]|nr:GGDEF domain-containing protein [Pseudohongiellaceae bacterium]